MQILLIIIAIIALFSGGFYLRRSFEAQNRLQFHLAGLAMLSGVVISVILVEHQMLGMWYVFILLSVPTSAGYLTASTQSIHR